MVYPLEMYRLALRCRGRDVNPALKWGLQNDYYDGVSQDKKKDKPLNKKNDISNPIIAVQMRGGLGNQLFQAAAGMALSHRIGGHLVLDTSGYGASNNRQFDLYPLRINCEIRGIENQFTRFFKKKLNKLFKRKTIPEWWNGLIYEQPSFTYDAAFENLNESTYLMGYFQSALFFKGIELDIAKAFDPVKFASPQAFEQVKHLQGDQSVAVHIRRGDYAHNPVVTNSFGIIHLDYYDQAIEHLRQTVPNPKIYIFSDDKVVAREAASRWLNAQVMEGQSAGDDLFLMSNARHHILANSSFSWWSAWLDQRRDGIRIAPKQWFTPAMLETHPTHDLIPSSWTQI